MKLGLVKIGLLMIEIGIMICIVPLQKEEKGIQAMRGLGSWRLCKSFFMFYRVM